MGSSTVMLSVWLVAPPEVLAHTVKSVCVMLTVGVPLTTPSLKFKPAGSAGDMDQLEALAPETEGDKVAIWIPRIRVKFSGL